MRYNVQFHGSSSAARFLILLLFFLVRLSSFPVHPVAAKSRSRNDQLVAEVPSERFRFRVPASDCPVEPPCYCAPRTGNRQREQRISCGAFMRQRRFPRFVETIEDVDYVSLIYSGLTVLPNSAFSALKVSELDLQGNNFSDQVSGKAFIGVNKHLLALNLAWSNITRLPAKVFRGMTALRNLSLAENRIHRLPGPVFHDLRSLEQLTLAGNSMADLIPDVFRHQMNLHTLDLGYCNIERISWNTFNGLWNLKSLDLRGNRVQHLEQFVFSDLVSLHSLLLGHNPLRRLRSKVFHGLKNLKVLNLAESSLERIEFDVFRDTPNIELLDLGDNRLSFLPMGTLLLPHLEHLTLDGNQLTDIPNEVAYLPALRYLDVSYNRIQSIDRCMLENHVHLEYLNLRENPFHCNCSIFWLRGLKNKLMSRWKDNRKSLPFVPGKCWMPVNLRDTLITSWLDLKCVREQDTSKCNRI